MDETTDVGRAEAPTDANCGDAGAVDHDPCAVIAVELGDRLTEREIVEEQKAAPPAQRLFHFARALVFDKYTRVPGVSDAPGGDFRCRVVARRRVVAFDS